MNVGRLSRDLELAGCQPRRIGRDVWLALCPTCKQRGDLSIVEIREPGVVACPRRTRAASSTSAEGCGVKTTTTVDPKWLVERVAHRVVELLEERTTDLVADRVAKALAQRDRAPVDHLVDAGELARILGVSRTTIYDNASKLGAIEAGIGTRRPRLRFDVEQARAAWTRRDTSERSQPPDPLVARHRERTERRTGRMHRSAGTGRAPRGTTAPGPTSASDLRAALPPIKLRGSRDGTRAPVCKHGQVASRSTNDRVADVADQADGSLR